MQSKKCLHEIVPYCVFGYWSVMSLCLFNDGGQVASAAIFHEDVENSSVSIYKSIMISYDVFVVEIFENVPIKHCQFKNQV